MKANPNWHPSQRDGYRVWHLPADYWSGCEYPEDTIRIFYSEKEKSWSGDTECDQNTQRNLTDEEVESVKAEFELSAR